MNFIHRIMSQYSVSRLFFEVLPITCLVGIIYAVYRCIRIKKDNMSAAWRTEIMRWLFVCYLTGLINLVLVPENFWSNIWFYFRNGYGTGNDLGWFVGSINLVPTLIKYIKGEVLLGSWVRQMIVGNILMFIPMGFFLTFVSTKINGRSIWKYAIVIPVIVEVIQPTAGRSFDIDDLICNIIGILVGFCIAVLCRNIIRCIDRTCSEE